MKQFNILVANDDGIWSPGLQRLVEAATKFGKVWVAAPSGQCSGMSHKLTIFDPIEIEEVAYPVPVEAAYSIGGTPADCVKMALTTLLPVKPDFVLSGINKGYNAGFDIAYSGTLGAAMEALMNDVPAIAFSTDLDNHFDVVDQYIVSVIEQLLAKPRSLTEAWNVNFPGCTAQECQGIAWDVKIAPVGFFENFYTKLALETGAQAMQPDATIVTKDRVAPDTDIYAVLDNHIAIGKVRCNVK